MTYVEIVGRIFWEDRASTEIYNLALQDALPISGGIDVSVGSVIAFTGVFLAKAIGFWGISPLLAFPLVLVMGCAFGAFMGLLIDALKIPAFIITLAGMFFLRGVSYLVSEESIPINHPVYDTLSSLAWKIPGGGRLSAIDRKSVV